jgi:translocation and assembly module TamB
LHAFNRRTVAEIYFSTPEPLRLRGTIDDPVLTGRINIDRGAIFLADPDLARKLAVETLSDLSGPSTTSTSALMTTFMTNLRVLTVPVTLGEDVRLRSSEADVRLAGQLELVKSSASTRLVSPSGDFVPGLTLTGTLYTTAGTYTLKFGNVPARDFAVLPNGTVNFDGTSPETPLVDIKAQYNVKRLRDRDLAVIVNLTGRLPNPQIKFTSDNEYPLEDSDLLSYLIIGQPGFDFTNASLPSVLSPTASAVLTGLVRNTALSSYVSSFQLELGTTDNTPGLSASQGFSQAFRTATLDVGIPIYKNLFLGVNAGYCQVLVGQVGAKVEYRFRPDMSLQGAFDPAATNTHQGCNDIGAVSLFPSPSQFSFSIHKSWRF